MDSERWERVQELFHESRNLPPSEQQAFVEANAGGDHDLARRVLEMLAEHNRAASLLDRALPDLASQMIGAASESIPTENFGRYRIQRKIGEGGMGVVYLAQREDLGYEVAIKILGDATLSPARRDRFTSEQRLLAQLTHAHIARLYDADTLPDGTPWFAMEYVEGVPLTDYCREHHTSIEERLRLFRNVCEAVKYAHDHAIIHRDLKPSNILVNVKGEPKLLDFGIAKQMEASGELQDHTRTGLRLMTPAYASPEQARSETVGVYTDVYSLGVILYEMLAGKLPYDLSGRTPAEAERVLTDTQPVKPSIAGGREIAATRASQDQWNDLDVLCLTAMHKDIDRRYQSAEALIRDIDHYLKHEPLEARPDSFSYRLRKFVARNRQAVVAASLTLTLIAGLIVFFTIRLAKARDAALAEAARTQRVDEFLQKLFQGGEDTVAPPEDLKVLSLIDRGAKEAEALKEDPKVQADLLQTLGTVYQSLGKLGRAESLINSALKTRQKIYGPDNREVADSLLKLAALRLEQARMPEAEKLTRESIAMFKRHLQPDHPLVVQGTVLLGRILQQGDHPREAIPILRGVIQSHPAKAKKDTTYISALSLLGDAYYSLGDFNQADSIYEQVEAADKILHGARHPEVADDLINRGNVQTQLGKHTEAEKYYREAMAIDEAWFGKDSPRTADAAQYVGQSLESQDHLTEAKTIMEQSLATNERVYGKTHPRVALALLTLGAVVDDMKNYDEAEAIYIRAVEIFHDAYGDRHRDTLVAMNDLASLYRRKHEFSEAEKILHRVIAEYQATLPADHPDLGIARLRLGDVYFGQKRYREAESELLAGYTIVSKKMDASSYFVQKASEELSTAYDALKQPEKAARFRANLTAKK